ncbi:hypothetical protein COV20_04675 [Candidatus Woesearchaeota archaeon CG10_big_fil_rev_8_21_14_0_10_45_16]|nr:MAG: hypothetical protein COV20_04675 [Candidatus Woesearchaeota archaeon CG10_big_fil_rev_8_21_14_0_10_45_16]
MSIYCVGEGYTREKVFEVLQRAGFEPSRSNLSDYVRPGEEPKNEIGASFLQRGRDLALVQFSGPVVSDVVQNREKSPHYQTIKGLVAFLEPEQVIDDLSRPVF